MRTASQVYCLVRPASGGRVETAQAIDGSLRVFVNRGQAIEAAEQIGGDWVVGLAELTGNYTFESVLPRKAAVC